MLQKFISSSSKKCRWSNQLTSVASGNSLPYKKSQQTGFVSRHFFFQNDTRITGKELFTLQNFLLKSSSQVEMNNSFGYLVALVLLILATSFLNEQAAAEEKKKNSNSDDSFDFEKFKKIISASSEYLAEKINDAKDKDIVLVIGNTGAGKSTTINYLLGSELEATDKATIRVRAGQPEYAKIGDGKSETLYPQLHTQNGELYYCDCPGFQDTKGEEAQVANLVNIQALIHSVDKIKGIVIVVDIGSLTGVDRNKESFLKLAQTLSELLKISKGEMSENLKKSIIFIFTKTTDIESEKTIVKRVKNAIEDLDKDWESKDTRGYFRKVVNTFIDTNDEKNQQLNEEFLKYSDIRRVLELINESNVSTIKANDCFDHVVREKITKRIENLTAVSSGTVFQCNFKDNAHMKFKQALTDIAASCGPVVDEALKIKSSITQLKHHGLQLSQDIKSYESMVKASDDEYLTKNADRIKYYKLAMERIARERKELEQKKDNLSAQIKDIDSTVPVEYWSDSICEKAGWVGWYVKSFKYSGIGFSEAKSNCKNGKFSLPLENKTKGTYEITYTSNWASDGDAKVSIFVEKRYLPGNQELIRSLKANLHAVTSKLDESNAQAQQMIGEENKRRQSDSREKAKEVICNLKEKLEKVEKEIGVQEKSLTAKKAHLIEKDIMVLRRISEMTKVSDLVKDVLGKHKSFMKLDNDPVLQQWAEKFPNEFSNCSKLGIALAGLLFFGASLYCARYGCEPIISKPPIPHEGRVKSNN